MVLPGDEDACGECGPAGIQRRSALTASTALFSYLPFVVTFILVSAFVLRRLFPFLSGDIVPKDSVGSPELFTTPIPRSTKSNNSRPNAVKRISAATFSTTIALSTVLAELILCDISDSINPVARGIALRFTVFLLLIFLIAIIPSLEIQSFISASGYRYFGSESGRFKIAWVLHMLASATWLVAFWWSGQVILPEHKEQDILRGEGWIHGTTEHVGVIGISLMALLSGFASISAPWQSFGARTRPVTESTVARKQAGLESTNEMLATKRSRLRAIEQRIANAPPENFLKKAMGSFRGTRDTTEKQNLEMEINGLENMALELSAHHSILASRYNQQERARTASGKLLRTASQAFSIYCMYRVISASLTFVRRHLAKPSDHFVGSDPINNILALLVKHYDSQLDRQAWAQQISFLMTGVMLFASFSSVLQTFHFFARYTPNLLKATQANLPLIVAQTSATYVISVSLLLRGIMPGDVVSNRLQDLGGNDMAWVDGWFEAWFLAGACVTALGIWAGRKISGTDEDWDDGGDVEMGKVH